MDKLPYTHLLYVRKYSILENDYPLYVYGVNTTDIHHTIGEYICRSFEHVKQINYVECTQSSLDYWKEQNIPIYNFVDKYPIKSYKETPKKPIKEIIHDEYDCDDRSCDFEYERLICPNCSEDLVNEVEDRDYEGWDYCPNCGQKLDWSDEHDK